MRRARRTADGGPLGARWRRRARRLRAPATSPRRSRRRSGRADAAASPPPTACRSRRRGAADASAAHALPVAPARLRPTRRRRTPARSRGRCATAPLSVRVVGGPSARRADSIRVELALANLAAGRRAGRPGSPAAAPSARPSERLDGLSRALGGRPAAAVRAARQLPASASGHPPGAARPAAPATFWALFPACRRPGQRPPAGICASCPACRWRRTRRPRNPDPALVVSSATWRSSKPRTCGRPTSWARRRSTPCAACRSRSSAASTSPSWGRRARASRR